MIRTGYKACIRRQNFSIMQKPVLYFETRTDGTVKLAPRYLIANEIPPFNDNYLTDERAWRNHAVDKGYIKYEIMDRILENLMMMADKES